MKTIENQSKQNSAASFDRSLYEWVPRHELAEIVPQIVKTIKTAPAAHAAASGSASASDEIVLSILVYCYAIGVYRSSDIAERVRRNKARGPSLSRSALDGKALAHYRRANGALVKQCLASALQQAFQVQWTNDRSGAAPRARNLSFNSNAASALDSEAERRLEVAEAWDLFDQEGVLGKSDRR
jgi:hypothetical protein